MTSNRDLVGESTLSAVDVDFPLSFNIKCGNNPLENEELIAMEDPDFEPAELENELDPIALNYTSGTTSARKEWCIATGVAARGGTNVCIRKTTAVEIYGSIARYGVTHMCCAPVVFNIIRKTKPREMQIKSCVQILTGGAPPPAILLQEMDDLGFQVMDAYGFTEATGAALVCEWRTRWNLLPQEKQGRLNSHQGVSILGLADFDVKDIKTKKSVPHNGVTKGEVVIRGSSIMKGYWKNEKATIEVFEEGWFHTGDIGVIDPDGYIEIKDILKDVIISGGDTVEMETVIFQHPMVLEAVVVVKKVSDEKLTEQEILEHSRSNLPHFMVPKKVIFLEELPKTALGKPRKDVFREILNK